MTLFRHLRRVVPTLALLPALALGAATTHHRAATLTPWEQAVAARAALPEHPTRAQYDAVLDRFRAIYHANPADAHAPESAWATAQLLTEAGRTLPDEHLLTAAVGQFEFLRKSYPASHYRADCLLGEAEITADDLHERAQAKALLAELQAKYPHSANTDAVTAALAALRRNRPVALVVTAGAPQQTVSVTVPAVVRAHMVPLNQTKPAEETATASVSTTETPAQGVLPAFDAEVRHRQPAQVTGIRHWSTPSYTRVAIDLSDEVQYEAARVPHPDRIYFDLHGARLAQELAGKTFDVSDNGFLTRVRAAQYSADVIRVVLDVNDVTDYSAFLLPNPFRLIIDIHGGAAPGPMVSAAPAPPATAMVSAAPVVKHDANTYATDLADLSKRADKVRATTVPTSGPIAAVTPSSELAKELQQAHAEETVQTPASATPAADAAANDGYPPPPPAPAAKHSKRLSGMSVPAPAPLPEPTPLTPTARTTETPESGAPTEHEADLTAAGQRSLARALGLKVGRIVIDAGHGGHDTGTIGAGGIYEKDVVLDVALRLGKLLHERLGVDVIYTRSDDTFIPLETRTAIANKAQADLFLSIHANSSSDASARGVETYYLNFTSDPNALEVAARENAVSQSSMYQLSDLVKKITLKDKIDESREFALDVDTALYAGLERGNAGLKNRGIKKAPFVVLIGANMPSILTEISFVTNPRDAAELETPEYRERVAESIYKGVAKYASGLSGVKPTARAEADEPRATVAQR